MRIPYCDSVNKLSSDFEWFNYPSIYFFGVQLCPLSAFLSNGAWFQWFCKESLEIRIGSQWKTKRYQIAVQSCENAWLAAEARNKIRFQIAVQSCEHELIAAEAVKKSVFTSESKAGKMHELPQRQWTKTDFRSQSKAANMSESLQGNRCGVLTH